MRHSVYRLHVRRVILGSLPLFVGVILVAYASLRILDTFRATHSPITMPVPTEVVTRSTPVPAETKPDPAVSYEVAADLPRRVLIPSIGVDGFIQQVGKDETNSIAVPTNIFFAGWYVESAKPGEKGLSIIDGHVSGRYAEAIFANLAKAKVGDEVKVEYGDRSMRTFRITNSQTVTAAAANKVLFEQREGAEQQLHLITCGGTFDKQSQRFDQRVIVVAERVN